MDGVWQAWSGLAGYQQALLASFTAAGFALFQPLRWVAVWMLFVAVLVWIN